MRKIVAGLLVSANGVVEAPDTWTGPHFTPEIGHLIDSMMDDWDTLLLGRVTYQGFADAFGGQAGGMADRMNSFPKVAARRSSDLFHRQQVVRASASASGSFGAVWLCSGS